MQKVRVRTNMSDNLFGSVEGDFLDNPLDDGVQTACSDVLMVSMWASEREGG